MATTQGNAQDYLKKAFAEGYEAFNKAEPNARGFWHNPGNPYKDGSLPNKEWQRGYDRGFWDNARKEERTTR